MTHRAFIQHTSIALQVDKFQRIARFRAGRDRMRAIMAAFTIYSTMTGRKPEQGIILGITRFGVTGIAARLIQPGTGISLHLIHPTVAVGALEAFFYRHDIPQTFRHWTRMAVVTAVRRIGYLASVHGVHGIGETCHP